MQWEDSVFVIKRLLRREARPSGKDLGKTAYDVIFSSGKGDMFPEPALEGNKKWHAHPKICFQPSAKLGTLRAVQGEPCHLL